MALQYGPFRDIEADLYIRLLYCQWELHKIAARRGHLLAEQELLQAQKAFAEAAIKAGTADREDLP